MSKTQRVRVNRCGGMGGVGMQMLVSGAGWALLEHIRAWCTSGAGPASRIPHPAVYISSVLYFVRIHT